MADFLVLLDAVIGHARAAGTAGRDRPQVVRVVDLARDHRGHVFTPAIANLPREGVADLVLQGADRGRAEHAFAGLLDDIEEGPLLQRVLHVEQAVRRVLGEAGDQAGLIGRETVGRGDDGGGDLARTHQRRAPVVDRLGHDVVDRELPVELRRRVADRRCDGDCIVDAAREEHELVIGPRPLAELLQLVQEVDQARAVIVLGRVVLEDAIVAVKIVLDRKLVAVLGVVVDVGDPRIRDGVVLGTHRQRVVTVDDCVHLVPVDQAPRGRGHGLGGDLLGILEVDLDGPPEDTAEGVDLLDRQVDAGLEVARILRAPTGVGQHGADRDRLAVGLGAVVQRDEGVGPGHAHRADGRGAGHRHEAAPRRVQRIDDAAGGFDLLVELLLLGLLPFMKPLHRAASHCVWFEGRTIAGGRGAAPTASLAVDASLA